METIISLVHDLVFHVAGDKNEKKVELCMRILSSRIQSKSLNLLSLEHKIKKVINDSEKIIEFQELFMKLQKHEIVTRKAAVLHLLLNLRTKNRLPIGRDQFRQKCADHFTLMEDIQEKAEVAAPIIKKKQITKEELHENELIKQVLFVFQGIETTHIYYDTEMDKYCLKDTVQVLTPMKNLIEKLCEMGWLYNKVVGYMKDCESQESIGVIVQSFCSFLHFELADYYRLVAILESHLERKDENHEIEMTMGRLRVWTQDAFDRIRLIACLTDSVQGLKGGAIISSVFAFAKHGDPCIIRLVDKCLNVITIPFYYMLRQWIFEGALNDSHTEFFIVSNPSTKNQDLWKDKYSINTQMLPNFISRDLANKILVVGKSINFIRICCDRSDWVMNQVTIAVQESEELSYHDTNKLEKVVQHAYEVTNDYLTEILHKKYFLLEHCHALKQYLLLGQGDFIQYLMDLLWPELSKQATHIYRHNLSNIMETALNSSNGKYQSLDILKCLDVNVLEPSPGDDGWAVFTLHYKVPSPLNTVINDSAMLEYLEIFYFLWRLKRVDYALSTSWVRDMNLMRLVQDKIPQFAPTLQRTYLQRSEMIHFVTNLHNYMMFEVLETSWHQLVKELQTSKDLDEMIDSHFRYLANVKDKALMMPKSKTLLVQLKRIFDTIIQFCKLQELIYTSMIQQVNISKRNAQEIEKSGARGEWGVPIGSSKESNPSLDANLVAQFDSVSQTYNEQFEKLMTMLEDKLSGAENLRFLTFRLDFNEYYRHKAEAKLGASSK